MADRRVVDADKLRALLDAVVAGRIEDARAAAVALIAAGTPAAPPQRAALSTAEVAQLLGISVATVKRRIADGELESFLLGGRRLIPVQAVSGRVTRVADSAPGGDRR